MTLVDVQARIDEIEASNDSEKSHGLDDELHVTVLQAIAEGTCADSPAKLAALTLTTLAMGFDRWCA